MASTENKSSKGEIPRRTAGGSEIGEINLHKRHPHIYGRLDEINSLQHRNPLIHWAAFVISLISLIPSFFWIFMHPHKLNPTWMWIDIGLGVFFGLEFLTRSGLRWNPTLYVRARLFDFVALILPSAPCKKSWK